MEDPMIKRVVLFLYQLAMYLARLGAAPTDVAYARGHPMYLCNWLPREVWARIVGRWGAPSRALPDRDAFKRQLAEDFKGRRLGNE
jgi:hypothetical protein